MAENSLDKKVGATSSLRKWLSTPVAGKFYYFNGKIVVVTNESLHKDGWPAGDMCVEYKEIDLWQKDYERGTNHADMKAFMHDATRLDIKSVKAYVSDLMNDATKYAANPELFDQWVNSLVRLDENDEDGDGADPADEFGLTTRESANLEVLKETGVLVAQLRAKAELIGKIIKARMEVFNRVAGQLRTKLKRIEKVVGFIETYLGEKQEVVQIASGRDAGRVPVCIRQLVQYMDEEAMLVSVFSSHSYGVMIESKVDWNTPEVFDAWLLENPSRIYQVIPESKGIVAIKPSRRQSKESDARSRSDENRRRSMTYLLIRNGDNLYRVWTNTSLGSHLFPTTKDNETYQKAFEEAEQWGKGSSREEEAFDLRVTLAKNMALIQGILDRTDLLSPLPTDDRLNLNDPAVFEKGLVKLIRDGEKLMSVNPIPTYSQWQKSVNQKITRGTRVFLIGVHYDKDNHLRYTKYRRYSVGMPEAGIYTVDDVGKARGHITIHFVSGETYWGYKDTHGGWSRELGEIERRQKIGIHVYLDEVINYDEIDLDLLETMIKDRSNRGSFMEMLPIVIELMKWRKEELAEESAFARLLSEKEKVDIEDVEECIEWWKRKVINKRPISSDNKKAWRMIVSRARRLMNGEAPSDETDEEFVPETVKCVCSICDGCGHDVELPSNVCEMCCQGIHMERKRT